MTERPLWYTLADDGRTPLPTEDPPDLPVERRQIKVDHVQSPNSTWYLVSTVFLQLDHNWRDGPPLLWETMVFLANPDGSVQDWSDVECRRYTSYEDATRGHAEITARYTYAWIATSTAPSPTEGP